VVVGVVPQSFGAEGEDDPRRCGAEDPRRAIHRRRRRLVFVVGGSTRSSKLGFGDWVGRVDSQGSTDFDTTCKTRGRRCSPST